MKNNKTRKCLIFLLGLFVVVSAASDSVAQVVFRVTDLGAFNGGNYSASQGMAINQWGIGTGYSNVQDACGNPSCLNPHAFVSQNQVFDIGFTPVDGWSYGNDINDNFYIAGSIGNPNSGDFSDHAYLFNLNNSTATRLFPVGFDSKSIATGINNNNQVIGYYHANITGVFHGFIWQNGALVDLGSRNPNDINSQGDVVGNSPAFYRDSISQTIQALAPLQPGSCSAAMVINEAKFIGGHSLVPNCLPGSFARPVIWYKNASNQYQVYAVPTPGFQNGFIKGMNNIGFVVGYVVNTGLDNRAYIYYGLGNIFYDLNNLIDPNSGWILKEATAINDQLQIIGYGQSPSGTLHAFRLDLI